MRERANKFSKHTVIQYGSHCAQRELITDVSHMMLSGSGKKQYENKDTVYKVNEYEMTAF